MIGLRADSGVETAVSQAVSSSFDEFDTKLGDLMRGERATMGKSLLDVQRDLRIRASYIAAIENADLSAFDAPSFISGYVRSYARYLHMDPEQSFATFCKETGFVPAQGFGAVAVETKDDGKNAATGRGGFEGARALYLPQPESFWSSIEPRAIGSLLVLVLLVVGLGYGGVSVLREVQKVSLSPIEEMPGIVAALDPTQEVSYFSGDEVLAVNLPRPDLSDLTFRPQILETPALTARDTPISAIDPQLATVTEPLQSPPVQPDHPQSEVQLTQVSREGGAAFGPSIPNQAAMTQSGENVEILAVRPAWVRVTAADGTVLLEKTLDAGERYNLPELSEPAQLRTGNSGAVYFVVSGQTVGPAAPGVQVIKKVELSPEALTGRYAAADLSKDSDLAKMVTFASAQDSLPVENLDNPAQQ